MANESWPLNTEFGANTSRTLLMRVREPADRQAWEEFVNRYAPKIFNWCRRYQLQESDAADVTQDVLVKLVRAMQEFQYDQTKGSFRGWLKTVTANAVSDLVGKWKRVGRGSGDTAVGQILATIEDQRAIEALSAEIEACHRQELLAEAERLVEPHVQAHTWQVYRLAAVEQRKAADVAEELGMPVSEVYVAKSRVMKMLRDAVKQIEETE
jgi:RNA polymerase sigma-70 factor, ECF subfamily